MTENYRNRPQQSAPLPPNLPPDSNQGVTQNPSGGFFQTFGLDVRIALLVILVDTMLFGGELGTLGALIPFSIFSAAVLAFLTYKIQMKWYGDDHDSAIIKAVVVGLVTAIPTSISPYVAGPGGLLGLVHLVKGKR